MSNGKKHGGEKKEGREHTAGPGVVFDCPRCEERTAPFAKGGCVRVVCVSLDDGAKLEYEIPKGSDRKSLTKAGTHTKCMKVEKGDNLLVHAEDGDATACYVFCRPEDCQ